MSHDFGALLRDLRKRNGMTQEELAARLGFSRPMVAMLEAGKRQPDVDEVIDLYIPALGLQESRELAARLIDLAASARRDRRAEPRRTIAMQHRMERTQGKRRVLHIPAAPTPLLGREREVESCGDHLLEGEVRLLTLVGPPGVGKTRLAQEVARRLDLFYQDGVFFVPLAGVVDTASLLPGIHDALNLPSASSTPLAALVAHLRHKRILLVLDNFEQILGAAPQLALLQAECHGVQILVTSRERLRLRAEHVVQVQPLAIDVAVDLFARRTQAVNPRMIPGEDDPDVTRAICRRLDCLPLAIELCAAHAEYASLAQLLAQLENRPLDMLEEGAVDLPPHQQTLRAAIRQSYDLLSDDERSLLQTLSVFVGGASTEMAAEVWRQGNARHATQFHRVARALIAKNLVQSGFNEAGEQHLLLLESIREFAHERLRASGDLAEVRAAHYRVCLRFARSIERATFGPGYASAIKQMQPNAGNMFAALDWAREGARWSELAGLLLLLWSPFDSGAYLPECARWCEVLLPHCKQIAPRLELATKLNYIYFARENDGTQWVQTIRHEFQALIDACDDPVVKAQALRLGVDFEVGFPDEVEALRQALALARSAPNDADTALGYEFSRDVALCLVLHALGAHLVSCGEGVESARYLEESSALHRLYENNSDLCFNLIFLGRAALLRDEDTLAVLLLEEAVEAALHLKIERALVMACSHLGLAYVYAGNFSSARQMLGKAREASRLYGDDFMGIMPPLYLTELAFAEGNTEEARNWFAECVAVSTQAARDMWWRHILRAYQAARLAAHDGNDLRAATYYGFARTLNERIKLGPNGPVRDKAVSDLAIVRARLGERTFLDAYNTGGEMSPESVLRMMVGDIRRFRINETVSES